jgi:hypothetical protein
MHLDFCVPDLIGFLARAWSKKTIHPMRGVPLQLNVPKAVLEDQSMRGDLHLLAKVAAFTIAPLPAGFAAGIHAVKQFELETQSLIWSIDGEVDIGFIHTVSAVISQRASNALSGIWVKAWDTVQAPSDSFTTWVDAQYETIGGWRLGSFEVVLNGLPASATAQKESGSTSKSGGTPF